MERLIKALKICLILVLGFTPVWIYAQDTNAHHNMGNTLPGNVTEEVTYDPISNQYIIEQKVGNIVISTQYMSAEEYRKKRLNNSSFDYWREKEETYSKGDESNSLIPPMNIGGDLFKGIFGSNKIEIRPQGSAELILGVRVNKTQNPNIPLQQRTVTTFNFDQNIQINLLGKIGDKIQLNANFNTKALFNFENQMNLKFEGGEDDILQLLEFGNVSLPLTGTLIQGSQALFGVKNKLKFGKFEITTIFSQQQGQKQNITVEGGAQITKFEVIASNYEVNRHYFVGDYFKNQYDQSNSTLPFVTSPAYITRMEVWVTNRVNATENVRNIVALMDLGEPVPNTSNQFPRNELNNDPGALVSQNPTVRDVTSQALFSQFQNGLTIEKLANARLLSANEYTFDPYLGYISLNQSLNSDEVLAVAYQYTVGGQTYQVGEFGTDVQAPNAIIVKLLKASNLDVSKPNWDWMMKNIYSIGGYNIGQEDFTLNLLYQDTETGVKVNYFPHTEGVPDATGKPLLQLFRLDRLNPQNDQIPDGFFDFVEGRTIRSQNGRIIFPVREPFGTAYLNTVFNNNTNLVQRYAFDSLYNTIQQLAELNTEKNRFYLGGSYKGASGSEISLNAFNVPQGSVTVTAGGVTLVENQDYTVDYAAGRVKIINESILNSGLPINISLENNATFNIQQKRLFGTHMDYKFSKNFQIGGTIMNLNERPLTQKIDIGNEPTSNWIWGLDLNYSTESNFITRLVDKIPGIDTKAPSLFTINGEFAHLIPGFNTVIDKNGENGVSYIDDFEGAETPIDVRNPFFWKLGTVPQHNPLWPNGDKFDDLQYGYDRAKLNWYIQDPLFYRDNTLTPPAIHDNAWVMSNNYLRQIDIREVFPGYQPPINMGVIPTLQVLDINFFPDERGPYNFNASSFMNEPITNTLRLQNPANSFGSMMRRMETTDWDGANIAYIEFWMMDPFDADLDSLKVWDEDPTAHNLNLDPGGGGDFYLQIGNMSEDLLRDGRLSYENGLPTPTDPTRPLIKTNWGWAPLIQPINTNFDNDPDTRTLQDVGYDGMSDTGEVSFHTAFLNAAFSQLGPGSVYDSLFADPSGDNYKHYTGDAWGDGSLLKDAFPFKRYKKFLGPENNSPAGNINNSYQQVPNTEDVNNNYTLDQPEGYYQYHISLRQEDLDQIGENFITDIKLATSYQTNLPINQNGGTGSKQVRWIQFRVPIRTDDKEAYGSINGYRSIRFMRMLLKGFPDDIFVRLGSLQLVRADWRAYSQSLWDPNTFTSQEEASFNVTTLNVEENSGKKPFPYALPPGITREIDPSNPQLTQLNEQALILNVNNLKDGEAKSVYKNTEYDFRAYKNLKMFVHVENVVDANPLDSMDITAFVRLGMDGTENYYEVEVPLRLSDTTLVPVSGATPQQIMDNNPYRRNVWPSQNELNIELQKLTEAKLMRNADNAPTNMPYYWVDPATGKRVTIVGNPNLANVRTIMIGVRNPQQKDNPWQNGQNGNKQDDAQPKSAQVWVNELRVTDYFESGGWAAKVRTQLNLADFGQISMAVSHTTFGFGNIDQKPQQRSRNNTTTFDLTTNFEFGKFFGPKAGVTIPVFFGYSLSVADPQFNPLDPDVYFTRSLQNLSTDYQRDSLKRLTQTVITRKSFNITNMRKNRVNTQRKPKIWDIENWDASYSYQEDTYHDTRIEYNNTYEHKASLGYTFTPQVKYWEPFKKSKKLKSKWAQWIKDFNFTWSPKRLAARVNVQRDVNELKLRNTTQYDLIINPTYKKNFIWVRTYEFQYSPFKSVTFTFNATNNSRIDEPEMILDQSVAPRVTFFGRNTSYTHNFDVNYQIPFSKLPLTDWLTASVGYSGNYKWTAGNMERDETTGVFRMGRWGNIAQNSTNFKVNAQANMNTLYNHIPWIKDLNKPKKPDKRVTNKNNDQPKDTTDKTVKVKIVNWEKEGVKFRKDKRKLIKHELKTENIKITVIAPDGHEVKGETQVVDKNRARFIASEDVTDAKVKIEGRREKKKFRWMVIPETLAKIVTGVKNISVNYNESNGTILPGYRSGTSMFGLDFYQSGVGPDFVFGRQYSDVDLANKIVQNKWLVKDSTMNTLFMRTHTSNLTANATYEPFKGFRVTLTANRTYAENYQTNYRYVESQSDFIAQNPLSMGNFTMSYMSILTSFGGNGPNFTSRLFAEMLQYRSVISARIAQTGGFAYNPNAQYQVGFGKTQQDVMLYAFLAAYTGTDPNNVSMNLFPDVPIPNWRVQFDGLKNIPAIKKVMKNIVLTHAYQSTYSLAGFQSNYVYNDKNSAYWDANPFGFTERDDNGNYISRYFLNSVSIVESFNPLIKVDMTFNNSLTANVEIKSSRNISLNFPNNQITENNTFEIIVGAGYVIQDMKLPFRMMGKSIVGNLNIRFDFGLRENSTVIRKITEEVELITAGQQAITIKGYAEYQLNKSLSARIFVDQLINNPFVANQYPTSNTNAGLSIRFTLTQ